MSARQQPRVGYWLTPAGCAASGGHVWNDDGDHTHLHRLRTHHRRGWCGVSTTTHGPVTIDGVTTDHVWGPFMPQDRTTSRRVCVIPGCGAVEQLDVSKA
ncbi:MULTISPECIES: hypothetical protein [unclassified Nocardioides]|uniref:hypothetical protein n=1 Tax=unclassified Nocardioides TaxID=2615069 RepID=UPI0009F048F4|nr:MULTISPECIES: hypothetical protein [unclassified Nocardioides]GAW50583.1 hypothetical protein PD653B2_2919 [Nocardioides sp. PD653-B2]GAW57468.1 hypothetical protein PD653_4913 [Nocardioides sp. PD653]